MKKERLDNLYRLLLENIADWIDSNAVEYEALMGKFDDALSHEELHIKMTDAAFDQFKSVVMEWDNNRMQNRLDTIDMLYDHK